MLRQLVVRDFAIIEHAELELGPGMTALTGETGAGKSLLVDALMLLGGARADAGFVRQGCERAELAAEFELGSDDGVREWLAELELDDGDACRVRRVLRRDGSSRAFVNDRPVTLASLKALGERLVEIHGQHEHQALLGRTHQLEVLDAFGANAAEGAAVREAAREWQRLESEAHALRDAAGRTPAAALDLLRHQLAELERDALSPEALREAESEHRRLAHAGELLQGCEALAEALDGDDEHAIRTQVARLAAELNRLSTHDARLAPVRELVDGAEVALGEAAESLARLRAGQELDPGRLAELDAQLGRVHDLARKHRVPMHELKARAAELGQELERLEGADQRLAAIVAEQASALARYREAAQALSRRRELAAKRLAREVGATLNELGMGGGRFVVALEAEGNDTPRASGAEQVEFLVSANPGQPERALRKIASGGELSRIGLAIEVAALGKDSVGCMVFDEVDAGIGGAVAEVVGRKLKALGRARQVLCVTHLAQVAAQADEQISVSKAVEGRSTRTSIATLDAGQRREEIARMLGGVEITRETRAHAEAMLKAAKG
jgi:DNA repair protein RecN (Recombination protein N)